MRSRARRQAHEPPGPRRLRPADRSPSAPATRSGGASWGSWRSRGRCSPSWRPATSTCAAAPWSGRPPGVSTPASGSPPLNLAILLASIVPMHLRGAGGPKREDLPAIRRWLIVSTVLMVAFLAFRVVILRA